MTDQSTDRYPQAKRIAMGVLEADVATRDAAIARACGDDTALVREVRWLIDAVERSHTATLPLLSCDTVDLSGSDALSASPPRYRLLRRVGEGGMGVVYLAERQDTGFAQQVALKVLNAAAVRSPTLLERFARERRLLARLEHPGIARLLDGGLFVDGQPYLAMEYVEGERIDTWCERQALDLHARIALFLKVCAAVEYAHRNLVIHRDLKPGNILVGADGEPKLLDFGIASLIDEPAHGDAPTEAGQRALTLAYASPEQVEMQPLTTAADVYGLGMVLYQLVAGQRPWQHISAPHQLSLAIVAGDIVPPSRSRRPDGPPVCRRACADIDAIVLKALRREASERYASVGALANDLRNWQQQRPVLARRGARLYRTRRYLQRNRWPLGVAVALLLSVLVGLVASLYSLHRAQAQQQLAQQRQQQLERMVRFQQAMYDSVDIDAMGRALVDATGKQVMAVLARGGAPADGAAQARAFAAVQGVDVAREAIDRYVIGHTLDGLDRAFPDSPLLAADLRQSLARALLGIGSYAHAIDQLRRVLAVRTRLQPGNARGLLSVRVDLAKALESDGQTAGAAAMYAQAGELAQALPATDPLRIAAEAGSARLLVAQGHRGQALARQQALLAELAPRLPDTDRELMALRRDEVDTLVQMGRRSQAREHLEPLLALDRRVLGPEHPETLRATLTLAKLLRAQGEFERSLALAQQVAAARERRLGASHPATEDARYLAATDATRLTNDAPGLQRVAAEIRQIVEARRVRYGADNPHTLSATTGLIAALAKLGDIAPDDDAARTWYQQAIALERPLLAAHVRDLGTDHPNTLLARGSLASLLDKAGDYPAALREAQLTLAGQRKALAPDDPIMQGTLTLIGDIDSDLGDWAAARDAYRQALDARAARSGAAAPHTVESASRLHLALVKLRDTAAAAAVRRRYLDPVIAMNPATLNASMRSVRDEAIRMLKD
jgi:serine/threonine-protein kinase